MARFSSLRRRRALRRAAVAVAPPHEGRPPKYRVWGALIPLALTLGTVVLLLRAGGSFLATLAPHPWGTSAASPTTNDANSLSAIAQDYYSAYQGTPHPPLAVKRPLTARFGSFAPRAVGSPATALVQGTSPAEPAGLGGLGTQGGRGSGGAGSDVSGLPSPFVSRGGQDSGGSVSGLGLNLSGLPLRQLRAQDEIAARKAASQRQELLLQRFLQTAQAREAAALQSDANETRRAIADAARVAGQLDLGPLPVELPDAEIQLEMTNLRLKLTPGLSLPPNEKAAAQARLTQLEAEWNTRLEAQRVARGEEITRLRTERPREVSEAGTNQLNEQTRSALVRNAQERQQVAAQLQAALRKDAAQEPLSVTLPAVPAIKRVPRAGSSADRSEEAGRTGAARPISQRAKR